MIRRFLAHVTPEELLLVPVVILVIVAVIAQPTAITRLFEGPYATPIPGDSPADEVLRDREPSPSPAGVAPSLMPLIVDRNGDRLVFGRSFSCPPGTLLRSVVSSPETLRGIVTTGYFCMGSEGAGEWFYVSSSFAPSFRQLPTADSGR